MITWQKLAHLTLEHLTLSLSAVLLAIAVAVPAGIVLSRSRRLA